MQKNKKIRKCGKVIKKPYISKEKVMLQLENTLDVNVFNKKNLNSRLRPLIEVRSQWFYFMYRYTKMSLQEIGDMFKKNHATVIHAIKFYNETLLLYPGEIRDTHHMLEDIFEPIAEKNKKFLKNNNRGRDEAMSDDIVVVKQRIMIGKLMKANIKLIERLKKLEKQLEQA